MPTPEGIPASWTEWSALHPTTQEWSRARILAGLCPADGNILRGEDTRPGMCPRCHWVWRYDVYARTAIVTPPEPM